jgi:ADP-ribose pyrophosphatase YjhB (NUDIX family)
MKKDSTVNLELKPIRPGFDCVGVSYRAIVINNKGEVLLLKTTPQYRMEPGSWTRPGGKPEFREEASLAVAREVKEETNLDIELLRIIRVSDMITPDQHWVSVDCLVKIIGGTLEIKEKRYFEEARWFSLSALPSPLNSRTKTALEYYKKTLA